MMRREVCSFAGNKHLGVRSALEPDRILEIVAPTKYDTQSAYSDRADSVFAHEKDTTPA